MIYVFEKNYDVPVSEMIDIPYSYTWFVCLHMYIFTLKEFHYTQQRQPFERIVTDLLKKFQK